MAIQYRFLKRHLDWIEGNTIWDDGKHFGMIGDKNELIEQGVIEQVNIPIDNAKEEVPVEAKELFDDIKQDLADDGKLNHSNNDSKKSPGRKKKPAKK